MSHATILNAVSLNHWMTHIFCVNFLLLHILGSLIVQCSIIRESIWRVDRWATILQPTNHPPTLLTPGLSILPSFLATTVYPSLTSMPQASSVYGLVAVDQRCHSTASSPTRKSATVSRAPLPRPPYALCSHATLGVLQ